MWIVGNVLQALISCLAYFNKKDVQLRFLLAYVNLGNSSNTQMKTAVGVYAYRVYIHGIGVPFPFVGRGASCAIHIYPIWRRLLLLLSLSVMVIPRTYVCKGSASDGFPAPFSFMIEAA